MIAFLSNYQLSQGMRGSVGEIGVHHGRLTALLGLFSNKDEKLWAADLFDKMQSQNIDKSGRGNMRTFKNNMKKVGLQDQFSIQAVNSLQLQTQDLADQGFTAFRYLSIDGGHTYAITLNDLRKANELIMEGGILVLDDFVSMSWLGVTGGLFTFVHEQTRLVPFYWGDNKIFLTTADHVNYYQQLIKNKIGRKMCSNALASDMNNKKVFPRDMCKLSCENERDRVRICDTVPPHVEWLNE